VNREITVDLPSLLQQNIRAPIPAIESFHTYVKNVTQFREYHICEVISY
jgi:hypothetical protein